MTELTPTMEEAFALICAEPGQPALGLPGGRNTVRALMRRGLVEVQGEGWRVYRPEHEHRFQTTMHLDGCHWYSTQGRCACGVTYQFRGERSPKADPWSMVWMDGPDECARCLQLQDGARPQHEVVIARV